MKRTTQTLFITSVLFLSGLFTNAQAQMYINGNVGMGMLSGTELTDESEPGVLNVGFDDSIVFGGAVGLVMNTFRTELEVAYQKNDIDTFGADGIEVDSDLINGFDGDVSSLTGLINGYFDFENDSNFTPYLTAGIGLSKVDVQLSLDDDDIGSFDESDDDSIIAYHIGAGVGYAVSETVTIDVRYRYLTGGNPNFDGTSMDYTSHNITGGIRFNF